MGSTFALPIPERAGPVEATLGVQSWPATAGFPGCLWTRRRLDHGLRSRHRPDPACNGGIAPAQSAMARVRVGRGAAVDEPRLGFGETSAHVGAERVGACTWGRRRVLSVSSHPSRPVEPEPGSLAPRERLTVEARRDGFV
jgi:hypothetical protein